MVPSNLPKYKMEWLSQPLTLLVEPNLLNDDSNCITKTLLSCSQGFETMYNNQHVTLQLALIYNYQIFQTIRHPGPCFILWWKFRVQK